MLPLVLETFSGLCVKRLAPGCLTEAEANGRDMPLMTGCAPRPGLHVSGHPPQSTQTASCQFWPSPSVEGQRNRPHRPPQCSDVGCKPLSDRQPVCPVRTNDHCAFVSTFP